eukprot:g14260.t1
MVSCNQPLASQIGMDILRRGGNAADACVAMAAALNVTEPCSTGIGGDCFAIFYDAKTRRVSGLNGSGASPSELTLEKARVHGRVGPNGLELQGDSAHCVTVPGAAAGWVDTVRRFGSGRLSLGEVLEPAALLAEEGFPVHAVTAFHWAQCLRQLRGPARADMLLQPSAEQLEGSSVGQKRKAPTASTPRRAPRHAEVFQNPHLANTFRTLGKEGVKGFYEGRIAEAIVEAVRSQGGFLSLDDLRTHRTTFPEPISVRFKGVDVWEIPPNVVSDPLPSPTDLSEQVSLEYLHLLIEAMRIAFADTRWYVADPDCVKVPVQELVSEEYAAVRRRLLDHTKASVDVKQGSPASASSTVSCCAVDAEGNACSFINSNYEGFGSGIVPKGCGFTLQNRGMCTLPSGELKGPFSVMGGFMQPQGHVQVLCNLLHWGMDPQRALDAPRFCIERGVAAGHVLLEDGVSAAVVAALKRKGHDARGPVSGHARSIFGRGQVIWRLHNGVLCGGSDGRGDGCAVGMP